MTTNQANFDSASYCTEIKNKNLVQTIRLFAKEEVIRKKGFGVITLRVYNEENATKYYGLSVLSADFEAKIFSPVCYSMVDSNLVLIKIDAVNNVLSPLCLNKINTKYIEKTNSSYRTSRYPLWLLEERNDSIIVLEKRF